MTNTAIQVYKDATGNVLVDVRLENDTIWLNQEQISLVFGVQRQAITKHIKNIYDTGELDEKSVCSILEHTGTDGKNYKVKFYNLDMIISIGYRVNSKQATQFRIRATNTLKEYITKGHVINEKRLQEVGFEDLDKSIHFIKSTLQKHHLTQDEAMGMLHIITQYTQSRILLNRFDTNNFENPSGSTELQYRLDSEKAYKAIINLKKDLIEKQEASELFGLERAKGNLDGIFGSIYQGFAGKDLYPTVQEKASHLLYFVVKNHPFVDGNKRSGAFLFVLFLAQNGLLYTDTGERKINDQALVALTLLIAQSNDTDKQLMIKLITQMLCI